MNALDLDPNLYAPLWPLLRRWYRRRKERRALRRAAARRAGFPA